MSASLVTFTPEMGVLRAINMLIKNRISGAPVVDKTGDLVGVLSEQDCLKIALTASYHGESAGRVAEYMQPIVKTVDADASMVEVATMFLQDGYRRYPVLKDNRLVGQVSRRDVLKALEALW
ncbi:MAG: CBS domain-containing protein [Gammaproteobacteria bacterium]|nr:CBS domain-containing protein [Gammaproteobacteria bacterium]